MQAYNAIFGLVDEEERAAATWGERLEPLVARQFQDDTGAILWPHADFGLDYKRPMVHPVFNNPQKDLLWTGTPDRFILADDEFVIDPAYYVSNPETTQKRIDKLLASPKFWKKVIGGWEGKTAGYRMRGLWGEEGSDNIPEMYLVQAHWYLSLARAFGARIDTWHMSVLIGGQDYRPYTITFNQALHDALLKKARGFWLNHILTRTPPSRSSDPAWKEFFQKFYPRDIEPLAPATEAEERLFLELYGKREQLNVLDDEVGLLENELKLLVGDRAGIEGTLEDGKVWKLTWKKSKDSEKTDWQAAFEDLVLVTKETELGAEIQRKHTLTREGARRFIPSWPKEPKETKKKKEKAA